MGLRCLVASAELVRCLLTVIAVGLVGVPESRADPHSRCCVKPVRLCCGCRLCPGAWAVTPPPGGAQVYCDLRPGNCDTAALID
ncbi:hypothetical protein Acsp04_15730 [Actinomadura sp. NBRC 104425]|nr:hypothetical protein Acsp04_15730 [Actinomadura sp. NBRC 104425]